MKCVISTTYSDTYLYFLPIVTWCWNRLGVDVICFMPRFGYEKEDKSDGKWLNKSSLVHTAMRKFGMKWSCHYFDSPKHKEATYAQCSRLYGACLDLPEDEVLITSDCDMAVFNEEYFKTKWASFDIYGADLTPKGQYPMCYISATVKDWRNVFSIKEYIQDKSIKTPKGVKVGVIRIKSYQECLDEQLGDLEAEHFRGNFWSRDQEIAYNKLTFPKDLSLSVYQHFRAKEGTQFSTRRYDRDDSFILERLSPDTIDFHLNRPGYEEKNFEIILTILKYHYPDEDFKWLIDYTNAYKELL